MLKINYGHGEVEWVIFSDVPKIPEGAFIMSLTADREEYNWVVNRFVNIPHIRHTPSSFGATPKAVWRGDIARFIYDNLV
jgi:hypothetical protein